MPSDWRSRSRGFWLSSNLALDLLAEFEGPRDLRKDLGRPSGAPDDYGSVAKDPSQSRLLDRDAFDSLQEQLDGAAIGEARLHDDSFIGDGHLRGIALDETNEDKYGPKRETEECGPKHDAARGCNFHSLWAGPRSNEKDYANEREDRGDQRMTQHDNPVQPRFILNGFTRDEMLVGVAQKGSLKEAQIILSWGTDDSRGKGLVNCLPAQVRNDSKVRW